MGDTRPAMVRDNVAEKEYSDYRNFLTPGVNGFSKKLAVLFIFKYLLGLFWLCFGFGYFYNRNLSDSGHGVAGRLVKAGHQPPL